MRYRDLVCDGDEREQYYHHEGILDQIEDTARSMGDLAGTLAGDLTSAVKERPYATLVIAAGFAFAIGALWKLSHRKPASRIDRIRSQLPDMPPAVNCNAGCNRRTCAHGSRKVGADQCNGAGGMSSRPASPRPPVGVG